LQPRIIGRYAVFDEVAAGGMATVHFGRLLAEAGFSRTVAIKRLHPQFARDPEFVTMFLDEARLASRIRHPNVVQTIDVVASGDDVLLVMEYVVGDSLSRLSKAQRPGTIPVPIAIAIMTAVSSFGVSASSTIDANSHMAANMAMMSIGCRTECLSQEWAIVEFQALSVK